ncbi:MAG: flagellar biosynthetic protein FliQ [Candidatus Gastranaerophilaceae bacterium]
MNQDIIMTLLQKTFVLVLETSVPILLTGMVLGLMVSVFQTVTQIQESTLTFVPKIIGGVVVLVILLPWMFNLFITNFNEFMDTIPKLIGG